MIVPTVPRVVLHPQRPPGVREALLRLAGRGLVDLVDAADEQQVVSALRPPGGVLVTYRWSPDFLQPGLEWVQAMSSGVEQFPAEQLAARGTVLCSASGVLAGCIAEHAFACLLAMTRNIPQLLDDQRDRRWVPRVGAELSQMVLGVLGLGPVGRGVAVRGRAFGMKVLGLRRSPGTVPEVDEVLGPDRLDELCRRSDALVICLPGGPGTRGLVGPHQLAELGRGWVVNVGRGGTLEEAALLAALRDGRLRGAALDVVDEEPPPPDAPRWDAPGLVLTGHSAVLSPRWGHEWAALFEHNLAAAQRRGGWTNRVTA